MERFHCRPHPRCQGRWAQGAGAAAGGMGWRAPGPQDQRRQLALLRLIPTLPASCRPLPRRPTSPSTCTKTLSTVWRRRPASGASALPPPPHCAPWWRCTAWCCWRMRQATCRSTATARVGVERGAERGRGGRLKSWVPQSHLLTHLPPTPAAQAARWRCCASSSACWCVRCAPTRWRWWMPGDTLTISSTRRWAARTATCTRCVGVWVAAPPRRLHRAAPAAALAAPMPALRPPLLPPLPLLPITGPAGQRQDQPAQRHGRRPRLEAGAGAAAQPRHASAPVSLLVGCRPLSRARARSQHCNWRNRCRPHHAHTPCSSCVQPCCSCLASSVACPALRVASFV